MYFKDRNNGIKFIIDEEDLGDMIVSYDIPLEKHPNSIENKTIDTKK